MQDLIVLNPDIHVGERRYNVGDEFKAEGHLQRGEIFERNIEALKRQRRILPLTRESFQLAEQLRRADGPKPNRWPDAYLLEKGIIDPPQKKPAKAAEPAPVPKKAKGKGAEPITRIEHTDQTVQVGEFFRTPRRNGNFTFWDVTNAAGDLMRATGFKTADKADEFIADLAAAKAASTESQGSATSGEEQEATADDGDVQPDPGG